MSTRGDNPPRGLRRGLTHYGDSSFAWFLRRSFAASMGYTDKALERPVVGIADTASGFNNCHRTVPELVAAVSRGVAMAGGLPIPFPTISLGEPYLAPTSMLFRNLMAMDSEEMIRAQPMDAVVLIGGCDKTVPAQLMAAASANLPAIQLVTGPMMTGSWRGERLGACTDCRRQWGRYPRRRTRRVADRRGGPGTLDHRRHLHGDGHRQHHGAHMRGARHDVAGRRGGSGGPCRTPARGGAHRCAGSRPRCRGPDAGPHHDGGGVRQRAARAARNRRFRPTGWCISRPSPGAAALRSISTVSTP